MSMLKLYGLINISPYQFVFRIHTKHMIGYEIVTFIEIEVKMWDYEQSKSQCGFFSPRDILT